MPPATWFQSASSHAGWQVQKSIAYRSFRRHNPKGWDGPSWLVSYRAGVLGKEAFVAEVRSPTVRRRELGALLRGLRNEKGLTVEQVANGLMCSPSKVSRMETGHGAVTPRDIRDLCNFYGVTGEAERDQLMSLARAGKQAGWWQGYDLDYFATYVGLEAEATGIRYFQSMIVPGLMQTPAYARAMHDAEIPEFTAERIDQLIEVRLTRQRLLERKPPVRVEVILDEAVLHRLVGGAAVMSQQLDRLIELSNKPNVSMQVIPYSAGAHPAMDSTFNILEFSGSAASVVYVEGLVGWIYVERPTDVKRYTRVFEHLRTVASGPRESIELMTRVGAGYNNPADLACPGDNRA
jgi:transcriptional regulator with XRE-family HTH domain